MASGFRSRHPSQLATIRPRPWSPDVVSPTICRTRSRLNPATSSGIVSAGHSALRLGESLLELLRAHAVDLRDRLLDGVRERRVDGVGPVES